MRDKRIRVKSYPLCDKCGQPVKPWNDCLELEYLITGNAFLGLCISRHLLPVPGCPGSPSRAQYLPGQPPDTRGFSYNEKTAHQVQTAFERLQLKFTNEKKASEGN